MIRFNFFRTVFWMLLLGCVYCLSACDIYIMQQDQQSTLSGQWDVVEARLEAGNHLTYRMGDAWVLAADGNLYTDLTDGTQERGTWQYVENAGHPMLMLRYYLPDGGTITSNAYIQRQDRYTLQLYVEDYGFNSHYTLVLHRH